MILYKNVLKFWPKIWKRTLMKLELSLFAFWLRECLCSSFEQSRVKRSNQRLLLTSLIKFYMIWLRNQKISDFHLESDFESMTSEIFMKRNGNSKLRSKSYFYRDKELRQNIRFQFHNMMKKRKMRMSLKKSNEKRVWMRTTL